MQEGPNCIIETIMRFAKCFHGVDENQVIGLNKFLIWFFKIKNDLNRGRHEFIRVRVTTISRSKGFRCKWSGWQVLYWNFDSNGFWRSSNYQNISDRRKLSSPESILGWNIFYDVETRFFIPTELKIRDSWLSSTANFSKN